MTRARSNVVDPRQSRLAIDDSASSAENSAVVSDEMAPDKSLGSDDARVGALSTKPKRRATAESMASRQREISVSEFFAKNSHLLGFDNPAKALLTAIKEAVDNSLDACEEAGILPDLVVQVEEMSEGRFRVSVQDNGPGIVRAQVPNIFAKLLYGSKFHGLKQSRGQQGIGISAAGLYAQQTTGKPVVIMTKTAKGKLARRVELRIDTSNNKPEVLSEEELPWDDVEHGTKVELELAGTYRGGRTSIDAYLEQTVIANPHMSLVYQLPKMAEPIVFERAANELPREPLEIKPHPHGIELGLLLRIMHEARGQTVKKTLVESFSRVSASVAQQVCDMAQISPTMKTVKLDGEQIEALHRALGQVRVLAPPNACVVPIGEDLIIAGLKRRFEADFYTAVTRDPAVYRGNPFVVECGIAYGGKLDRENPADIMRFANRVPLQYQPKACAMTEAVYQTNWKSYQLSQPKGSLPIGPLAVVLHLASVWVPFTSEAKEAVAQYPELLKEMRLAIQEAGRRLATHLRARNRLESERKRKSVFERYIPELSASLAKVLEQPAGPIEESLTQALTQFVNVEIPEPDAKGDEEADEKQDTAQQESTVTPSMIPPGEDPDEPQRLSERPRADREDEPYEAAVRYVDPQEHWDTSELEYEQEVVQKEAKKAGQKAVRKGDSYTDGDVLDSSSRGSSSRAKKGAKKVQDSKSTRQLDLV